MAAFLIISVIYADLILNFLAMLRYLETQLFCNGKVCNGIRIERLVGQASLNSAVDHQFDLITLDDTARI